MVFKQNLMYVNFFLISISLAGINAAKLPTFISPCKRNDPNLDKCIQEQAQDVIPEFAKGIPKFRVPVLDPMEITELKVNQGNKQIGLSLTLKNIKMHGMKHAKFLGSKTDLVKKSSLYNIHHDRVEMLGNYEVDGKILVLPIKGNGKCNITITNVDIVMEQKWNLIKKNGKEYMNITDFNLKMKHGQAYFKLENLFNGDKTLGDNMNAFLNENWKDVTDDVGPALTKGLQDVFEQITKNLVNSVPYNEFYPS